MSMDISELENNPILKRIVKEEFDGPEGAKESISMDHYQTRRLPTCDITGEVCEGGECCSCCSIAKEWKSKELFYDIAGIFPTIETEQNGIKAKMNYNGSFWEFSSFSSFVESLTHCEWTDKLETMNELPAGVKEKFLMWDRGSKVISDLYNVVGYMFLPKCPLVILCEDRIFVEAPYFEGDE